MPKLPRPDGPWELDGSRSAQVLSALDQDKWGHAYLKIKELLARGDRERLAYESEANAAEAEFKSAMAEKERKGR